MRLSKNEKRPINEFEDRRPGEMMLLNNMNNKIIPHLPCSSVYQGEYEKWDLYQEIIFYESEPDKKTAETEVHVIHAIINIWKI